MRTVNQLKDDGFTVQPATEALDCTEIVSSELFWYYNPKFHNSMQEVEDHLKEASYSGDDLKYRLTVSGQHLGDNPFPLKIIDWINRQKMIEAMASFSRHKKAMDQAVIDYEAAMGA